MEVRDIMKEAVIVDESATFRDALTTMIAQKTNSLLVISDDGTLVGEVSVSDLLDAVIPEYLDGDSVATQFSDEDTFKKAVQEASDKEVAMFMTVETDPIRVDDSLMAVAGTAIAQRRARIPVVDRNNRPVGIISRRGLKQMLAVFLGLRA